jgi:hypothetical protein
LKSAKIIPLPRKSLPETFHGVIDEICRVVAPLPEHKAEKLTRLFERLETIHALECDRAAEMFKGVAHGRRPFLFGTDKQTGARLK